ncbi:MAG: hypothetical protein IPP69_04555 [Flavobacteriales bacterium]|nr:hypothetical protein [Flavobacteriales bacterium]
MTYTFDHLTTIAACDEYVNDCGREKTAQENKKNNLLERLEANSGTSDLQQRIDFISQRITSNEGLIALNPPEEDLRELQISLGEMIKERGMLERKVDQIGTNWKNEIAFEINHCDAQIALRNDLITQLNTYKATLAA